MVLLKAYLQQNICGKAQSKGREGAGKSENINEHHKDRRCHQMLHGHPHCSWGQLLFTGSRLQWPQSPSTTAHPHLFSPQGSSLQESCSSGPILTQGGTSLKSRAWNRCRKTCSGKAKAARQNLGQLAHNSDLMLRRRTAEAAGPAMQSPGHQGAPPQPLLHYHEELVSLRAKEKMVQLRLSSGHF